MLLFNCKIPRRDKLHKTVKQFYLAVLIHYSTKKSNTLEHFIIKTNPVNTNIKIYLNSSTTEIIGGHNLMPCFLTLYVHVNLFYNLQSSFTFNYVFISIKSIPKLLG